MAAGMFLHFYDTIIVRGLWHSVLCHPEGLPCSTWYMVATVVTPASLKQGEENKLIKRDKGLYMLYFEEDSQGLPLTFISSLFSRTQWHHPT